MRARAFVAALSLLGACAHSAPAAPPADAPPAVWPAPPEAARARFSSQLPRDAEPERRAWWRRALSAAVGEDEDAPRPDALLVRPFGVAADASVVVVADPDAAAVLRFDARGGSRRVDCAGRGWAGPLAVALEPGGAVYVADGTAGIVARVAPDGRCTDIGGGVLERPSGVAWANGRLYVVDPPRHAVVAFDTDGRQVLRFGSRGTGDGEMNFPTAIAADPGGDLLVVDALNFRVVRFSSEGRFLGAFGKAGDVEGTFGRPKGVAASERQVFVSDAHHDVVLVFDRSGVFEYLLGEPGVGPGQLSMPAGVALSGRRLFVASSQGSRIQVYELLGESS
jgi:DNA-binding beta-propeller fold protein YncE